MGFIHPFIWCFFPFDDLKLTQNRPATQSPPPPSEKPVFTVFAVFRLKRPPVIILNTIITGSDAWLSNKTKAR